MSSSTSSSSPPRLPFLKVLLVAVLGMGLSLVLVRAYAAALGASGEAFLGRVIEARAALPRIIAEEDDLVLFFGSSMTQAGFSARVFDRALAERGVDVKSFNFGFGGLNPLFQDYLARRVREAFEERGSATRAGPHRVQPVPDHQDALQRCRQRDRCLRRHARQPRGDAGDPARRSHPGRENPQHPLPARRRLGRDGDLLFRPRTWAFSRRCRRATCRRTRRTSSD